MVTKEMDLDSTTRYQISINLFGAGISMSIKKLATLTRISLTMQR